MVFDHLRHSALTHAEDCGAAPDDVRHLAAHASSATTKRHYLQQSERKTREIQKLRGLID